MFQKYNPNKYTSIKKSIEFHFDNLNELPTKQIQRNEFDDTISQTVTEIQLIQNNF